MNREELVAAVAKDVGLTRATAKEAVAAVLDNIQMSLAKGEKVTLVGFGNFDVVTSAERTGRNPQTGESVTIPAGKRPKFTAGKSLKDAVSG